jgi:Polyketide cyclase / dehydrase and lipid transport
MSGAQRRLTGRIQVALPPGEAFRLFTPRGEQDWVRGWHPRFPAPAPDDTEPGTVFETSAHGEHTIWLVTGREPGRRICYARVTPGEQAGTVTVTTSPAGRHSEVEVTYELTALTALAEHKLTDFAGNYPAYLQSWQEAIAARLGDPGDGPSDHDR